MVLAMRVDFSDIIDAIGTVQGVSDAVTQSPEYIADCIKAAHAVASKEFDIDAAASAGPLNMSHVYEFGVRGITRGSPRFADPTAPEARLWVHGITGEGRVQNIYFLFREAVQPNPRPSASFYGVSSAVISKLSRRKYVFKRKASVVEFGETVYIKPKDKTFNFVPFYGKPARNPAYRNSGGYIFRPYLGTPMESNPGEDSGMRGTFTSFWQTWWIGRGDELMSGQVNEYFTKDVQWLLNLAAKGTQPLEDVVRFNSRGRVYNRRRRVKAKMIRQAHTRGKVKRK